MIISSCALVMREGKQTHLIVDIKRWLIIGFIFVAMLAVAPSAHAYVTEVPEAELWNLPAFRDYSVDPDNPVTLDLSMIECWMCHGTQVTDAGSQPSGPHGGYMTTTNKCATCHAVHSAAAGGVVLLQSATVIETCEMCHDGTSGTGVYGVIEARGQYVNSDHNMADLTTSIPGGDADTGGSRDGVDFSGVSGGLTCTDCHSPHGANVVDPFTGDRARSATDTAGLDSIDADSGTSGSGFKSTRILRQQPIGGLTSIDYYGSDWCSSCHQGRLSKHGSGSTLPNHPVDSEDSSATSDPFSYDSVVYWNPGTMPATGSLGRTNRGYVMPDKPRVAAQVGHGPICQQCHEDARSVGNVTARTVDASETFTITKLDGLDNDDPADPDNPGSSDNPRFQVFPHESNNYLLLLEEDDNLCTNCHKR